MYDPPTYVWALTLAGAAGIPAATVAVLHRAAAWHGGSGRGLAAAAAGALAGLLGLSAALAGRGVYEQPGGPVPWLAIVVTTALGSMLAATGIPAVSRALVLVFVETSGVQRPDGRVGQIEAAGAVEGLLGGAGE